MSLPALRQDDGFFHFISPTDEAAYVELRRKHQKFAKESIPYYERKKKMEVRATARWQYSSYSLTEPLLDGCRAFPPTIIHSHSQDPRKIHFDLNELITGGPGKDSQVWKGNMSLPNCDTESEPLDPVPVIVKIFQDSLMDWLPRWTDPNIEGGAWEGGMWSAKSEAWAYFTLESMQGRDIPWSYGFYKFALPTGEIAYGHVMEFVEGDIGNFVVLRRYKLDDSTLRSLANNILAITFRMNALGVAHCDIAGHNILYRPHDLRYLFVIINFSAAEPLT